MSFCLIKDPQNRSPYWIAVFSIGGKQIWRTTKVPIKSTGGDKAFQRKKAEEVARAIEKALRLEHEGKATEANLKRIFNEILESTGARPMVMYTVAEWLDQWLETRKGSVASSSLTKYKQVRDRFLKSLGKRESSPLDSISPSDFLNFRKELTDEGRAPQTADRLVRRVLGTPFSSAFKQGLLPFNPLATLSPLQSVPIEKGVFALDEIARLFEAAAGDWKGAILVGFYTGARLSDISNLRWSNLEVDNRLIKFTAKKTAKVLTIPMLPELHEFLLRLPTTDNPNACVFPTLARHGTGGAKGLSAQFRQIMDAAGVAAGIARERKGKSGRTTSLRSFHSLRHSFNSALANAGVSQEIRQKLTGHASAEMNSVYTHHELEPLRQAVSTLPWIGKRDEDGERNGTV